MTKRLHRVDFQLAEYRGWFALRAAIFAQAFEDWESYSAKSRKYVTEIYATLSKEERYRQLRLAYILGLKWRKAAEIWEWFHSKDADTLLIDTSYKGSDIWTMYETGSWNRGGIKDKPYAKPVTLTTEEMQKPLPDKYRNGVRPLTFAEEIYIQVQAAKKRKNERSDKAK